MVIGRLLPSLALTYALLGQAAPAAAQLPFSATMFSDVAEKVTPAVVNITTRRERGQNHPFMDGHPMFREFFGPGKKKLPPEMGAGSGVVVSANGEIVTNNHVVEGADEITVVFADKREFKAKLIGADKSSDLAFLKIEAKNLPYLAFGNSDTLRLGEIVLAIGNPFGVGQTVTMGIVSAKGRANVGIVDYEDFIQTDASINPGNSGGALVNLRGELVGINTAIISRSGGAQGIGFAVPATMVQPIRQQIAEHGRVRRGWLGVAIQDLTPELARSLKLPAERGVLVSDVMEGGPAAKAKLISGDVIVSVNGQPTHSAAQLRNAVALIRPGTKTKLEVIHEGKAGDLWVLLEEKKDDETLAAQSVEPTTLASGLALGDLDGDLRSRLGVPAKVQGAVVMEVQAGSAAERAGLEQGDVITAANNERIRSAAELTARLKQNKGEVVLRVFKRGMFTFMVLKP